MVAIGSGQKRDREAAAPTGVGGLDLCSGQFVDARSVVVRPRVSWAPGPFVAFRVDTSARLWASARARPPLDPAVEPAPFEARPPAVSESPAAAYGETAKAPASGRSRDDGPTSTVYAIGPTTSAPAPAAQDPR